jgi:hypothetical protein
MFTAASPAPDSRWRLQVREDGQAGGFHVIDHRGDPRLEDLVGAMRENGQQQAGGGGDQRLMQADGQVHRGGQRRPP